MTAILVFDRALATPQGRLEVRAEVLPYPDRDGFYYPRYSVTRHGHETTTVPPRHPLNLERATASARQLAEAEYDHALRCMQQPGVEW